MQKDIDDLIFPDEASEYLISKLNIETDNLQEIKDIIYYINGLTSNETVDIVNEIFNTIERG